MNIIILSLISTVVFGIIDAVFFLFFEETLQEKIKKLFNVSISIAEVITGALSASTAIFVASNIRMSISEELYLVNNPLLDVTGILLGTFIVTATYIFYLRVIRCRLFKKTC